MRSWPRSVHSRRLQEVGRLLTGGFTGLSARRASVWNVLNISGRRRYSAAQSSVRWRPTCCCRTCRWLRLRTDRAKLSTNWAPCPWRLAVVHRQRFAAKSGEDWSRLRLRLPQIRPSTIGAICIFYWHWHWKYVFQSWNWV